MKQITHLPIEEQIEFVEEFICSKFLVSIEDLLSSCRSDELAIARRASIFILSKVCKMKGKDIASRYGKTSVTHQIKKMQQDIDSYDVSYDPFDSTLRAIRVVQLFITVNKSKDENKY